MEILFKICVFLTVNLLYMLEIIETQKICKVPNGDAGTCIPIKDCQPLMALSKKKYKTPHENMYYQQSYCGGGPGRIKVCCPSPSLWHRFDPKPVSYPHAPHSPPVTQTPKETPPLKPAVLSIPTTDDVGTRILPEEQMKLNNKYCGIDTSSSNRIFGGTEVKIDQYPWLALLEYAGEFLACGGSIISPAFILTAAHCLDDGKRRPIYVRVSEYNTSSFPTDSVEADGGGYDNITVQIIEVKNIYIHPNYSRMYKIHDIGLVEMKESVDIKKDFTKAICLPEKNFIPDFMPSTNFTIAGWGGTRTAKESDVKLEVSIPYVPWEMCEKVQGPDVKGTQICAGGIEGQDSCEGDSGGPLMYEYNERFYAVGIISYGHRSCGQKGRPATHTNVYEYMSWIKDILSGKNRN